MHLGGIGPAVVQSTWIQISIATLLVGLRAHVASRMGDKWRWDFLWIVLALFTAIASGFCTTMAATHGLGNHLDKINLTELQDLLFWEYHATYVGTLSIACSKFSVTALLLDVQYRTRNKLRRYALWTSAILFAITSLLEIFFTAFQCAPDIRVWLVLDLAKCPLEQGARAISYVHAITGGLTDVFLAVFPITFVWDLRTSLKIKIGFCALMGVGIIPGAMSFYRFRTLRLIYTATDISYALGTFTLWAGVELGSLIILGSIPPLRSLFKKTFNGVSNKAQTFLLQRIDPRTAYNTRVDTTTNIHIVLMDEEKEWA